MFYNREFERSLFISITFHTCLAIIFFFITFHHRLPSLETIEISIVKLPEKEEPKIIKPKIREKKIIIPIKKESRLKAKEPIKPTQQLIVPASPKVMQDVKEIITPPSISPIPPGGIEKNEFQGDIPVPKAEVKEEISQTQEGKTLQVSSIPPSTITPKDGEEQGHGPAIYITGPASKRKPLYQPLFKLPYWVEKRGQSLQGKLEIWVLPDGSVDRVEIDESFGYAEIDRLAQTTIYKWRFYKLPPDVERIERGIVFIAIRLE